MTTDAVMETFDQQQTQAISRVEKAIAAFKKGEIVLLTDDEDRENEGDLILAAEFATSESINFMAVEARGLICIAMTGEQLDHLALPMMPSQNQGVFGTAFTVSIEARYGVTTGISAADRAQTIRVAVDPKTTSADIVTPGHIFPLRARDGGVLVRTGQTEGSVDLAKLSGLIPGAVLCEIMNPDGTMARRPELEVFAKKHNMVMLSVADIIAYRLRNESLIEEVQNSVFETEFPGEWRVKSFRNQVDGSEHLALVCGDPKNDIPTLVRVQHRWDTFDMFRFKTSPSLETIRGAMQKIGEAGCGVVLYLDRTETLASDLVTKHIELVNTKDGVLNVVPSHQKVDVNLPDETLRDLGIGSQILSTIGIGKMRVLTDRPKKIVGTEAYGLEVVEQVPIND